MTTNKQVNRWHRIAEQEEWIEEHGSDLAGYIARYGSERDAIHYGSGGEAIYAADLAQLAALVRDNTRRDAAAAADARAAARAAYAAARDAAAAARDAYIAAYAAARDAAFAAYTCHECSRVFDLYNDDDAQDWYFGHDCR